MGQFNIKISKVLILMDDLENETAFICWTESSNRSLWHCRITHFDRLCDSIAIGNERSSGVSTLLEISAGLIGSCQSMVKDFPSSTHESSFVRISWTPSLTIASAQNQPLLAVFPCILRLASTN